MILLVAIGVVVTFGLVFVVVGCFQCFVGKQSKGFSTFENPEDGEFREATVSHGNEGFSLEPSDLVTVDSSDFTPVTIEPLPDILAKTVSTSALRPRIRCIEKYKQESALRLISVHHPFPRAQLTYLKEIGSTWFGKVIETDADNIITGVTRNRVVVKVLKDGATAVEQKQFLEDVAPYRELDHTNVIRLLGQCTETPPLLLILELAPLGDLKAYINSYKHDTNGLMKKNMQLKFAIDVVSGLACLHRHHYVHHDLAARTCLVAGDQTVKIGDYGTCEEKYTSDYYYSGQELLPLRWMAPETLELQDLTWQITEITKQSNIWTYGVLLWEIMTFGSIPYTVLPNEQVLDGVIKQKLIKLQAPDSSLPYKDRVFEVMQFCWLTPEQRPTIEEVHDLLHNLYKQQTEVQSQNDMEKFDVKWDSLIPPSIQAERHDNIITATPLPKQFDSNFSPSDEAQHETIPPIPVQDKIPDNLSTTVNGGLDFSLPISVPDSLNKPDTITTPFKPTREHLTSTPMSKNENFMNDQHLHLEIKPTKTFETLLKDEGLSPMNDSALDEDAFESHNKTESKPDTSTMDDIRQAETLVTSADTVTSGVVTGDFSLSGKHLDQMTQSSSQNGMPSSKAAEIHSDTKEKSFNSEPCSGLFEENGKLMPIKDEYVKGNNMSKMDTDGKIKTEHMVIDNNVSEKFEIIPNMDTGTDSSVFTNVSNTDPLTDYVNISNHNNLIADENHKNAVVMTSTLAADIDEFMNASFDSPMNVSDDKSVDNLTDFSDLDMILNGKTSSDLSSSNEALEETNQNVDEISDACKTTSVIEPATEQVGKFVNNELKVFPNLNVNNRQALCEIKNSTPVNNFNRYSRAKEYFNDEQKDHNYVNGACSPVVNESITSSSQSEDDDGDDDTSNSSGSSYICDYNINNVESTDSKETDTATVVKTEESSDESETSDDSDIEAFSMNEEEILFASELYLSKGVNSPSVFEKTPLETIPEDDLPSPRELESFDIKFEGQFDDVFTSQDNFEWDDFMGESLVGRPRSSDISPKRALDFSDWMVEDDVSVRSNSSATSNSKNVNRVRGSTRSDFNSVGSLNSPSVRSSISESEVKRSQPPHKPKSYISELITNRSTGSLTSSYRNQQTSSFYSLYDNMDIDDSTSDEQSFTDLNHSNYSHNNIGLGNSYIAYLHDMISSKSNLLAAQGTNKVFDAGIITTDLDDDLPDYDLMTDVNKSDSKENTMAPSTGTSDNLLDL